MESDVARPARALLECAAALLALYAQVLAVVAQLAVLIFMHVTRLVQCACVWLVHVEVWLASLQPASAAQMVDDGCSHFSIVDDYEAEWAVAEAVEARGLKPAEPLRGENGDEVVVSVKTLELPMTITKLAPRGLLVSCIGLGEGMAASLSLPEASRYDEPLNAVIDQLLSVTEEAIDHDEGCRTPSPGWQNVLVPTFAGDDLADLSVTEGEIESFGCRTPSPARQNVLVPASTFDGELKPLDAYHMSEVEVPVELSCEADLESSGCRTPSPSRQNVLVPALACDGEPDDASFLQLAVEEPDGLAIVSLQSATDPAGTIPALVSCAGDHAVGGALLTTAGLGGGMTSARSPPEAMANSESSFTERVARVFPLCLPSTRVVNIAKSDANTDFGGVFQANALCAAKCKPFLLPPPDTGELRVPCEFGPVFQARPRAPSPTSDPADSLVLVKHAAEVCESGVVKGPAKRASWADISEQPAASVVLQADLGTAVKDFLDTWLQPHNRIPREGRARARELAESVTDEASFSVARRAIIALSR
jgi:hypothetical protein